MGRADNIEAEFPPGIKMPAKLRQLCDFLHRKDYPISGYMRLRPEGEGLKAWFGDGSDAWRNFPPGSGLDQTARRWHSGCTLERTLPRPRSSISAPRATT